MLQHRKDIKSTVIWSLMLQESKISQTGDDTDSFDNNWKNYVESWSVW